MLPCVADVLRIRKDSQVEIRSTVYSNMDGVVDNLAEVIQGLLLLALQDTTDQKQLLEEATNFIELRKTLAEWVRRHHDWKN